MTLSLPDAIKDVERSISQIDNMSTDEVRSCALRLKTLSGLAQQHILNNEANEEKERDVWWANIFNLFVL